VLAFVASFNFSSHIEAAVNAGQRTRALITQEIDESRLLTLKGNTRPEANAVNDRGAVADDFQMEHMLLQLQRPPEQEQALKEFIDQLHNPASPNFHRWLSAPEFGEKFGLAPEDLNTITTWLQSHGFQVNMVYPSGMLIDFSGSVGQVREAFRTEIHNLEVRGVNHIANLSDPQIPAALAPAVVGVVSLHDFRPHPMNKLRPNYTFASGTYQAVVPADLATIYNLNPLFSAGTSGQGQTIVVIEDTNVYSTSDWTTFRSTFGLSGYSAGSFTQVHPAPTSGANNCSNPGVNGDDVEAILDAEWASAAAPSAAIELASCSDTNTTFGGLIALQNLLNASSAPPAIVSISYGECEAYNGASANAAYSSAYQQAVAEGVSVFVSSGDEGAASCDAGGSNATHGIGVSGFASTPYNVAMGGTDFGDSYANTNNTYWNTTNGSTYGSALSYIPEIPWNDSCASTLIATYEGYGATYGSSGFCNSGSGGNFLTVVSGSGGPSGCATGTPSTSGVVSGTCQGFAKPSWQSIVGNPSDGVRDIPDLSLFAANGVWGHWYVFCWSDTANGGASCSGAPSGWAGAGGTSFSSPIMAGIQALVNQKTGSNWGNPNPVYYQLAANEYGSSGSSSCNSSQVNVVANSCVFYDVTQGDMDVNCTGTHNCYGPSGTNGVLSTSSSSYSKAYGTTTGWDFATGIGTVNAYNLVTNWNSGVVTPTASIAISSVNPSSITLVQGGSAQGLTVNLTRTNFTGSVTLSTSSPPNGVTATITSPGSGNSGSISLQAGGGAATGNTQITITASGSGVSATATFSLTVTPTPSIAVSNVNPSSITLLRGGSAQSLTVNLTRSNFTGGITLSTSTLLSGVTATFTQPGSGNSGSIRLQAASNASAGSKQITITAGGSGVSSATATFTLTVTTPTIAISSVSPSSFTLVRGGSAQSLTVNLTRSNFTGSVALSTSGLPSGVAATYTQPGTGNSGTISLKAASNATLVSNRSITITASGSGVSATATSTLTVTTPTIAISSVSSSSVTLARGGSASLTVNLTRSNFAGSVTLSTSSLPSGVTATYTHPGTGNSGTISLKAASNASLVSNRSITINASGSGVSSATATFTLTVSSSAASGH
jgi:subtilase family serine protease